MKIFLLGFMGSGKTYWGKIWAKETGFDFYDLDSEIEKIENRSVDSIFQDSGEDHFRKSESETLRSFLNKENCIIACGGGTPCFFNNLQWMNENGMTVYLQATPDQLTQRLIKEKSSRPLIKNIDDNDLFLFIEKKLHERETFYLQAKYVFPIDKINASSFLKVLSNE